MTPIKWEQFGGQFTKFILRTMASPEFTLTALPQAATVEPGQNNHHDNLQHPYNVTVAAGASERERESGVPVRISSL